MTTSTQYLDAAAGCIRFLRCRAKSNRMGFGRPSSANLAALVGPRCGNGGAGVAADPVVERVGGTVLSVRMQQTQNDRSSD